MKRFLTAIAALFAALLLPGCLQSETTINLKKDGSGTLVEQTTLGPQMLAMLEQFSAIGGDQAKNPLDEAFSEDKAKARAKEMGEGVTFEKSEKITDGPNKGARVTYRFADINKLKFTPGSAMNDVSPAGAEPAKAGEKPISFAYNDGKLTIGMPEPDKADVAADDAAPESNPQMEAMMKEMLKDMKVSVKLVAEPGVAATDATYHDGNTITLMEMEMGKVVSNPDVMKKLMSANQKDPEAAMQALKGVDGVKMETKQKVSVTLK